MSKKNIAVIATIIIVMAVGIGTFFTIRLFRNTSEPITNFDECVAKGYPILESFPERCSVPGGNTFVREIPEQTVTIKGEVVCLPHFNTKGPQTMECAIGLKDEAGSHYALSDPEFKYMDALPTGAKRAITGLYSMNLDPEPKYNIVGTITINSVEPNEEN